MLCEKFLFTADCVLRNIVSKYVKNRQRRFQQCTQQETENVIEVLMLQLGREEQSFLIKIYNKPDRKTFYFGEIMELLLKASPYRVGSRLIFIFCEAYF